MLTVVLAIVHFCVCVKFLWGEACGTGLCLCLNASFLCYLLCMQLPDQTFLDWAEMGHHL